ncbi:MAG: HDOD domain-containing protein [Gammaproteobacteria bacterium]|nr:MAG: HDOD domain-containing protein [Gammaproteobacteria bacterium]
MALMKTWRGRILRQCGLTRGSDMGDNRNKVTIEANLITLPDIDWRLKEILDSHDYSLQDIVQLIVYDPGLTARLLRIVNSAFFGFATKIDTG